MISTPNVIGWVRFSVPCILLTFSLIYSQTCWPYPTTTSVDKTGGQFAFTQDGMNKYMADFIPLIEEKAIGLVIPDVDEYDIDLGFTDINLSITDIHFDSATIQTIEVNIDDPYISITAVNSSAVLQCNYMYQQTTYPYVKDSGWFTAALVDMTMMISLSINLNRSCNALYMDLLPIQLSIEDVDIEFYGGASWLYDLIADLLTDIFIDLLVDPLASIIHDPLIDAINTNIANDNPISHLGDDRALDQDLRFTDGAFFGEDVFGLRVVAMIEPHADKGLLMWQEDIPAFPLITEDADAQLYCSYMVFLSQFESLRAVDKLQGWITPEDAGEYAELLTTDFLANYIPGLDELAGHNVSVFLNTTEACTIISQPVALFLNLTGTLDLHLDDTAGEALARLGVSYGYTMVPSMKSTPHSYGNTSGIVLDASVYNQTTWLEDTSVGSFDTSGDLSMLVGLLGGATASYITELVGNYSLEIPGSFVKPDNFEFVIRDEFLQIDFNL